MKDTPLIRIVVGVAMILFNGLGILDQNTLLGQTLGAALAFAGLFLLISGIVKGIKNTKTKSKTGRDKN